MQPMRIFVSYVPEDQAWASGEGEQNIVEWFASKLRDEEVEFWPDPDEPPVNQYETDVEGEIEQADIALLLLSPAYLASPFIETVQLPLMERRVEDDALWVLPIVLEACEWERSKLLTDALAPFKRQAPLSELLDDRRALRLAMIPALDALGRRIREFGPRAGEPQRRKAAEDKATASKPEAPGPGVKGPVSTGPPGLKVSPETRRETITDLLRGFLPQDDMFVAPHIPQNKKRNARRACKIPADEKLAGLVDCTVFGSAKNAVAFSADGVYYHNDWTGLHTGSGCVRYERFKGLSFGRARQHEVDLGPEDAFEMSGSSVTPDTMVRILEALQRYLVRGETPIDERAASAPSPSVPGVATDGLDDAEALERVLERFGSEEDCYVGAEIPESKLARGRSRCQVPLDETIVALVDCTVMGSAKYCLLIGLEAIYYRNRWIGQQTGVHSIPYGDFTDRVFVPADNSEVALGYSDWLETSGTAVSEETLAEMLTAVRQWAIDTGKCRVDD